MKIKVQKGKLEKFAGDLLVVNLFQGLKKTGAGTGAVNKALRGLIDKLIKEEKFNGKQGETMVVPVQRGIKAKKVLLLGMGLQKEFNAEVARKISSAAVKKARELKVKRMGTILHGAGVGGLNPQEAAQAVAEGSMLAGYTYTKYKSSKDKIQSRFPSEVVIVDHADAQKIREIISGVKQGEVYSNAAIFARDLVNEPSSNMVPKDLADIAQTIAKSSPNIEVKVYNQKEIEKMGMGAFLAVAKGSDDPPYFIHLTYKPGGKVKKVAFVGKGITFDSGGLSLKPANYMETMQLDMAGSATVLGIFHGLAKLKPNAEVHGLAAVCENMPSGHAMKPGDIVKTMNGKTIEVLNTDAEGRLTLADALSYAVKNVKPDAIVDFATLTMACVIALGEEYAGCMGNNKELMEKVKSAAENVGERVWELPMPEEYKEAIKSQVADYINTTPTRKGAGTITAGLLLQEFVGKTPWVHIDIAGPSWAEKQVIPYMPKGGTGFGVRTGLELINKLSK